MKRFRALERLAQVADRAFDLAGRQSARDGFQGRRLAGAVRADQGDQLALVDFQVDALDGLDAAVGHVQARYLQYILVQAIVTHACDPPR
ncbi:hypothetical protein D3C72_1890400 [compost metagenome]